MPCARELQTVRWYLKASLLSQVRTPSLVQNINVSGSLVSSSYINQARIFPLQQTSSEPSSRVDREYLDSFLETRTCVDAIPEDPDTSELDVTG